MIPGTDVSWNLQPLDPEEHAKWAKVYADEAKVEDAALAERGGFPRRPGDPEPYTVGLAGSAVDVRAPGSDAVDCRNSGICRRLGNGWYPSQAAG